MKRFGASFAIPALGCLLALWGCLKEPAVSENCPFDPADGISVVFTVRMPGTQPATYAIGSPDESRITTLDLLVFKETGSGESFLYRTTSDQIADQILSNEKRITALLRRSEGAEKHRVALLANLRSEVEEVLAELTPGMTKTEVMQKIRLTGIGKWKADPADFRPLPMWGETDATHIISQVTTGSTLGAIRMVRSLARIDVGVNLDPNDVPQGLGTRFLIGEVKIYGAKKTGYAVPHEEKFSKSVMKVTAPSIVAGGTVNAPLAYSQSPAGYGLVREIYLLESDHTLASLNDSPTCVLVGGYYTEEGASPNTTRKTWYRIDFYDRQDPDRAPIPVLRNFRYRVNIASVYGPGYGTEEEAYNSVNADMDVDVIPWDEGDPEQAAIDGQHLLKVSQSTFRLSKEAHTTDAADNKLRIYTDYPGGWRIEKIVDVAGNLITDWLQVDAAQGPAGAETVVSLLLEGNYDPIPRTGYLHIRAGNLTLVVTVEQTTDPALLLVITDEKGNPVNEMNFASGLHENWGITIHDLNVDWMPADRPVTVSVTPVSGNGFLFGTGDCLVNGMITGPALAGNRTFVIDPPVMTAAEVDRVTGNPFLEKSSKVEFTIYDGYNSLTRSVILRQIHYDAIPVCDDHYLMDGQQHSFTVRSNAPWSIVVKDDPGHVFPSGWTYSSGGVTNPGERKVYFDIANYLDDPSVLQRTVTLTISSTNGTFDSHDFTLDCVTGIKVELANSYIVSPGGTGILIPVSRANADGKRRITSNTYFIADLVWTDQTARKAPESNIRGLSASGTGDKGYVFVLPGSTEGNAVVSAKVGDNIIWSWHIWVTAYDPEQPSGQKSYNGFTTMDRNLGALENGLSERSYGLFYQWGRKDPFPGVRQSGVNEPLSVYSLYGPALMVPADQNDPEYAIRHPFNYITGWTGSDGSNSWSSASGEKTLYDPCPEGWRVPVLAAREGSETANSLLPGNLPPLPWFKSNTDDSQPATYEGDWNSTYGGWTFTALGYDIGAFPAAGQINVYGTYSRSAISGAYWSGRPIGGTGVMIPCFSLARDRISQNAAVHSVRDNGFSVRCVKDR